MVGSSTPTGRKARRNPTVCTHAFPSKKKPSFPGPTERSAPDPPPRTPTQHRKSTGTRRKLERRSHHFFHHSQLIRNHMARSFLSPPPKSRSGLHLPCTAAVLSVSISLHFPKSTSDPSYSARESRNAVLETPRGELYNRWSLRSITDTFREKGGREREPVQVRRAKASGARRHQRETRSKGKAERPSDARGTTRDDRRATRERPTESAKRISRRERDYGDGRSLDRCLGSTHGFSQKDIGNERGTTAVR